MCTCLYIKNYPVHFGAIKFHWAPDISKRWEFRVISAYTNPWDASQFPSILPWQPSAISACQWYLIIIILPAIRFLLISTVCVTVLIVFIMSHTHTRWGGNEALLDYQIAIKTLSRRWHQQFRIRQVWCDMIKHRLEGQIVSSAYYTLFHRNPIHEICSIAKWCMVSKKIWRKMGQNEFR